MELLDDTLKLRHCTTLFTMHFPHGLYLGLEMVVVKGSLLLLVLSRMQVVMRVKESD